MFKTLATTMAAPAPVMSDDVSSLESGLYDLIGLESEIASLEAMCTTQDHLAQLAASDTTGGLESLMSFLGHSTDLMTTTALSVNTDTAALEGIGDALKNTLSKIVAKAGEISGKIKDVVVRLASGAAEKAKQFGAWAKGKALNAKATVAAHPKTTAFAVIGGLAIVAAVVATIWGVPVPKTPQALVQWGDKAYKAITGIKLPGFSTAGSSIKDLKIGFKLQKAATTALDKLEWTAVEIQKFSSKVGDLAEASGPVQAIGKTVTSKFGPLAGAAVKGFLAGAAEGAAAGLIYGTIVRIIMATFNLVRTVVGGIIGVAGTTLSALRGGFKGSAEADAAA